MTVGRVVLTVDYMYEIAVRGRLPDDWPHWFDGFTATTSDSPAGLVTTLIGPIVDQAQLHGVLANLRDLALPLEWLRHIEPRGMSDRNTPLDT